MATVLCVRPVYYVADIVNPAAPVESRLLWEVCLSGAKRVFWDPVARRTVDYMAAYRLQRAAVRTTAP